MATSLQHPVHEHALILRNLSENCKTRCSLCVQLFHGPTYCCLDCDIFLDESCASIELPLQVQHPAHPKHPLALDGDNGWYRCHECRFDLFALEAFMTLTPADEHRIQHFAHEHPLAPFCLTTQSWSVCKACRLHMSGEVYGCSECRFLLHESCAKLPREIQHPFHHQHPLTLVADFIIDLEDCYECRVCGYRSRFIYQCDQCKLNHCVKCIVSTLSPDSECPEKEDCGAIEGQGLFHQHKLTQHCVVMENKISCQACQLSISGEVYCCFDCVFFIHKTCSKKLPKEMKHHLHQEHKLILRAAAPYGGGTYHCPSCLWNYNGMTFNCESCRFDLDPQCALQTLSAVEGGMRSEIQHFFHPHPLTLVYSNDDVNAVDCDACGEPSSGLAYCCQRCKTFMLHKRCAEVAREVEHQFHPPHPLVLLSRAPAEYFYCGACHKKSEGFTLCCTKCEFYLDLECASRKPTLKYERHEHQLAYFPISNKPNHLYCHCCGKSCNRDLYRCVPCNYNIHHDCLPLPPSIQHECHRHPLILFDRFVDGRPDDQYCDYCEEIRHPDHGVYHCAECVYTVHIECMIPTVKPVEPKPSENPALDELDNEIASLEAKMEVMERNLKAAKEKLEALSEQRGFVYVIGT